MWHCFKKMYVVYPHWKEEPGISEIYFLSCWFYKTINRHRVSRARAPAEQWWYCSLGKENWRGLLHLSIFPFSFSPTTCLSWHGEGPFWAQQVVLRAWHHLKLVQSAVAFFCSFATADVCGEKKTALARSLPMFVADLVSSTFFCSSSMEQQ